MTLVYKMIHVLQVGGMIVHKWCYGCADYIVGTVKCHFC